MQCQQFQSFPGHASDGWSNLIPNLVSHLDSSILGQEPWRQDMRYAHEGKLTLRMSQIACHKLHATTSFCRHTCSSCCLKMSSPWSAANLYTFHNSLDYIDEICRKDISSDGSLQQGRTRSRALNVHPNKPFPAVTGTASILFLDCEDVWCRWERHAASQLKHPRLTWWRPRVALTSSYGPRSMASMWSLQAGCLPPVSVSAILCKAFVPHVSPIVVSDLVPLPCIAGALPRNLLAAFCKAACISQSCLQTACSLFSCLSKVSAMPLLLLHLLVRIWLYGPPHRTPVRILQAGGICHILESIVPSCLSSRSWPDIRPSGLAQSSCCETHAAHRPNAPNILVLTSIVFG